jgi:hypothetical protein
VHFLPRDVCDTSLQNEGAHFTLFFYSIGDFVGKLSELLIYACAVILLSSCSSPSGGNRGNNQDPAALVPLSCIAVLPADTSVSEKEIIDFEEAQSLEKGAAYASKVIRNELKDNPEVRILGSNEVASLVPEISGGQIGTVIALGQKLNCDGVLLTTVRRYKQREGTEYAADSPASVNFSMVLRHSSNGNVLWSADFREMQQSFLSNIFSFTKAKERGFKWISVEELMEQGIKERLNDCPYLD